MRLAVMAVLISTAAQALPPSPCIQDGLPGLERHLGSKYREHLIAEGVTTGGERLLIYVSADGTWTMIAVTANGLACLVSSGDGFTHSRRPGDPS